MSPYRLDNMAEVVWTYWNDDILPVTVDVWERLDVPSWNVYHPALQECVSDVWKAGQSTATLTYLTFKPVVILSWMFCQVLWGLAQVLFRVLLSQGWIQLKKGMLQLKTAAIWFYRFQMSLSVYELLGEAAFIASLFGCYYFYKWVRRQTYWQRFMKWYNGKKKKAIETSTKFVERVARVSSILAMTIPHTAFLGGYVAVKVLFPTFVKWLAYDTYATALLSIWYPLIVTLTWVHEKRHGPVWESQHDDKSDKENTTPSKKSGSSSKRLDEKRSSYLQSTAATRSKENKSPLKKRDVPKPFSKTNPPKPETPSRKRTQSRPNTPKLYAKEPEAATSYWLRYWVVFALVQAVGIFGTMVPVFGSFVSRHPYMLHICSELKLLFFIWLFTMENILGSVAADEKALMAQTMPLTLFHDHVTPIVLEFEARVADSISKATWMSLVHSKVERVLDVFVLIKLLSQERKDWLLHVIEESRTLLVPSITLLMPSFITKFGVAYVQFVVPSAKSTRSLIATKRRSFAGDKGTEERELLYLQYWIIHCVFSGTLTYFSGITRWIPLATHVSYLLWCYLSLPKSIVQCYMHLETELLAFGLLPGDAAVEIHETKTAKILQAVYSRLPSAGDTAADGGAKTEGENKTSHTQRDNPLGRTISVDSQQTNVEITIRNAASDELSNNGDEREDNGEVDSHSTEGSPPHSKSQRRKAAAAKVTEREDNDLDEGTSDEDWVPPIKACESSNTVETEPTFLTNDMGSLGSSSTFETVSKETSALRRSSRRRRPTTKV